MKKDKNNKKNRVEKLRMVLDTPDNKSLYPEDEKYLKALARRLKESSDEEDLEKFVRVEGKEEDTDYLKPHVTVYPKKIKTEEEKKVAPAPPKKFITMDVEKKEVAVKGEDIFEVEKIEKREQKFVKVRPKEVEKQKESGKQKKESSEEELLEWKTIDAEKPKIQAQEAKEGEWETADAEEYVIEDKMEQSEPEEFIEVKKVENKKEILPVEKVEPEDDDAFEEVFVEKELKHDDADDKIKIDVFKDLKTVDDKTAIILFNSGFTCLDSLNSVSTNDLSNKTGIKKSKIKKIKREIDKKLNSKKPKAKKNKEENIDLYKEKNVQENFEKEEILPFKEKPVEVEPLDVEDTAEWKLTADELLDEEEISADKIKIDSFKEMNSVDEKIAVLLYDNGYNSIDSLKKATEDDLKKIKGLKRKKIKEIMAEIREKLRESVEAKSIDIDLAANAELTKEQLQIDTEPMEEEIELTDSLVELESDSAEWVPLPEKDLDKDEKKEFLNKKINKDKVSDELKIKAFKDLETIDDVTAIILYNGGIKSVKDLKKAPIKKLTKINGIKKSLAKQIKKEVELYETVEEAIEKDNEIKIIDDEDVSEVEISAIDENIVNHFESFDGKKLNVTENEEKEIDVFKDIKSIDGKIAKLLIENGIYSIDDLRETTIKDLTKIKGIRKKIAKEIKKEVDAIKKEKPKTKKSEKKKGKKSKSKPGKQYYLSGKNNQFQIFDPEQFPEENEIYKHGEYVLYEKEIESNSSKRLIVRFFSKEKPDGVYPIKLPEGYEVKENGNGIPYLKKKQ